MKLRRRVCGITSFLSFLWLLGVAGASDQGLLTLSQAFWQGLTAMVCTAIFAKLGGLLQ